MGAFYFELAEHISLAAAELTLHLAMFAAEGLVGQARIRMNVKYVLDEPAHSIVISGGSRESQIVAHVYAGLVLREFGEESVSMRISDARPPGLLHEGTVPA